MAKQLSAVVSRLERALSKAETSTVSDCELLKRFASDNDQTAFATVVARHTPMVLGVCRRSLSSLHDAEDACQAVFLLLARKAGNTGWHSSVASWLYTTARRVARNAMIAAARRARRDGRAVVPKSRSPIELMNGQELLAVLDEELDKLPAHYREPLVLCCLEGLARDEAAARLGVPIATLKSQLQRARKKLADALAARGCELGSVLLIISAAAVGQASPKLLDSILATASGKPSESVAALARGIAMNGVLAHVKLAVAFVGVVLLGLAFVAALPIAAQPEKPNANPPAKSAENPDPKSAPAKTDAPMPSPARPEPITLKGHTGEVFSVCFSPDGKRILTGGGVRTRRPGIAPTPGEVKVWDAAKGTEILAFIGHTDKVSTVCFSPDGKRIASSGADLTVRVWDVAKGQEILSLEGQARTIGSGSVCFSPDGKRIASISSDHVKLWDAENGKELLTLKGEGKPMGRVSFSPDGKRLAGIYPWGTRGAPGEIKVWDSEKGQELLTIKPPAAGTASVCFSPDGKRLASAGGLDKTVRVWDAENGKELLVLKGHTAQVIGVCFSPDGKRLASASWDETVKVWDAEKGQELLTLKGHTGYVYSVAFSPDGKRLASASKDMTVKVWDVQPGKEKAK